MQYVEVLVNTKTDSLDRSFLYSIPPEYLAQIRPNILIEVPFGNKVKKGLVYKIVRFAPTKIKEKIKPIKRIVIDTAVVNLMQIKLAKILSNYYLTNLCQIIFNMIPNLSKKIVKNIQIPITSYHQTATKNNQIYSIYARKLDRIEYYTKLIKKAFVKNRQVILLFPDFSANELFINKIISIFPENTICFRPTSNIKENTNSWIRINSEKKLLIIGTRQHIFNINAHTGLVIIDEPNHFGYKEEQSFHYHSKKTAEFVSKFGVNVVFGDSFPTFSNNYKKIVYQKSDFYKIPIEFMQYANDHKSNLNYELEKIISRAITNDKTIFILATQKEEAAGIICSDCETLFYCRRCEHILRVANQTTQVCPICHHEEEIPKICPNCHSTKIVTFGNSINQIAKKISALFPKEKITLLKTDNDYTKVYSSKQRIFVGTKYALDWKNQKFDICFLPFWHEFASFSLHQDEENIISLFMNISEIIKEKIIILSNNQPDKILSQILTKNIREIYCDNLKSRKVFKYPPYYSLIKFSCKETIRKIAEAKIIQLKTKLDAIIKNLEIIKFSEGKTRNKFHESLVIKTKISESAKIKSVLIKNYQKLNLAKYQIDADPIRLI